MLAEHDFTPDPCVSGIVENKSSSLRIAHTSDALIVTLPGTGYRLAELTEMTGRLAWCAYLDGEAGEVTIPTARSVYRHPIERPGRTHCTESDDTVN